MASRKRARNNNNNDENEGLFGNLRRLQKRPGANVLNAVEVGGHSIKEIIEMDFYKEYLPFIGSLRPEQKSKLLRELLDVPVYATKLSEIQKIIVRGDEQHRELMAALVRSPAMLRLYENLIMKMVHLKMAGVRGGTRRRRGSR
jgi:hypothetical protein